MSTNWENKFNELLKGKTIDHVRWMTKDEADHMMWYSRPMVIVFTDGTALYPQSDDEGNDGGALHYQGNDGGQTIWVER